MVKYFTRGHNNQSLLGESIFHTSFYPVASTKSFIILKVWPSIWELFCKQYLKCTQCLLTNKWNIEIGQPLENMTLYYFGLLKYDCQTRTWLKLVKLNLHFSIIWSVWRWLNEFTWKKNLLNQDSFLINSRLRYWFST